jgi:DNA repair protein RadA/Sms
VVLIGGDPGIGKSTLLLQSLADIASERRAVYQRRGIGRADRVARAAARAARRRRRWPS